jgi:hypothetical protein
VPVSPVLLTSGAEGLIAADGDTPIRIAEPSNKLEQRLDELYRAPPEEFTAARNALAGELKAAGEGEAAATVRRLKRPTQAAWLVNGLSLDHPTEVRRLLETAERLRELHAELGRSQSAEQLREAAKEEREALARLTELARDGFGGPRPSAATLDRVAETLQAAASDEETARLVSAGRLDRERRAASLAGGTPVEVPPAKEKPAREAQAAELKEARAALKQLQRRAKTVRTRQGREAKARDRAEAELAQAQAALESGDDELAGLEEEIAEKERSIARLAGRAR